MATYIIGDVQGCFAELQSLLNVINYDSRFDRLGFAGDLVNRGPDSLNVLRFVKSLVDPIVVLGNHDLHLLALASGRVAFSGEHTLHAVLAAKDKDELITWLRRQSLLYYESSQNFIVVHAGIPPQWSLAQSLELAAEVEEQLRGDQFPEWIQHIYGAEPQEWDNSLQEYSRWRYIVNAYTRMRFCDAHGRLDLENKNKSMANTKMRAWYDWYQLSSKIFFGHWAALEGRCEHADCVALDTGCAWGGGLTAYRVEDARRFYVPAMRSKIIV